MASKKIKIKNNQFSVAGRTIGMRRLAYDMFVHNLRKLGIPENCLDKCHQDENVYELPDFIAVIAGKFLRDMIFNRHAWSTYFKSTYRSPKSKTFEEIKGILCQDVRYFTENFRDAYQFELSLTTSLITELIFYLYSENSSLHLNSFAKFWADHWKTNRPRFEKQGGFVRIYTETDKREGTLFDEFCTTFVPAHCLTYDKSIALRAVFLSKYEKFMKLHKQKVIPFNTHLYEIPQVRLLKVPLQPIPVLDDSEKDEDSQLDIPKNTGLGIQSHENLLRDMGVAIPEASTSTEDSPSTSRPKTAAERRISSRKKEIRRRNQAHTTERLSKADLPSLKSDQPSKEKQ